jgi:phage baseplate assembly protein V
MSAATLAELQRRLANVVRVGTVEEADFSAARVKVRMGGILTGWLPMSGIRAGGVRVWSPLTVGEQVTVFSPSGDLAQGLVMPGTYCDANASPGNSETAINIVFPDGSTLDWDAGTLNFETAGVAKIKAGTIELEAGNIRVKGPVEQTGGDITSDSDVIAAGVSLVTHVHGGVIPGGGTTGQPV